MKYMNRLKSAAVKDIDIDIADILGQKYLFHIDIGKGDIDPPLCQWNATGVTPSGEEEVWSWKFLWKFFSVFS